MADLTASNLGRRRYRIGKHTLRVMQITDASTVTSNSIAKRQTKTSKVLFAGANLTGDRVLATAGTVVGLNMGAISGTEGDSPGNLGLALSLSATCVVWIIGRSG